MSFIYESTGRSRKFSAEGFLLSLLQSVTRGSCSLNHIALALGNFESDSMSRQALHNRFSPESTRFLLQVVEGIIQTRGQSVFDPLQNSTFRRVLVEDSTVISMGKGLAEDFPNNGTSSGENAGCKINLVTDLMSGRVIESNLHSARSPDQLLAFDLTEICRKHDLVLRDMGYFHTGSIKEIERREAFWVSRLPASVKVFDSRGSSLETLLKRASLDRLDVVVTVGARNPHRCRLVATRLDTETTQKNRRKRRRSSKNHGHNPAKSGLIRDAWSILITNLDEEEVSAQKLHEIYRLRWSVEIQFRALKQSCRIELSLNHKSDPIHIEALLLAAVIYQLLTLELHARSWRERKKGIGLSLEKLSDAFAVYLLGLTRENKYLPFRYDLRHLEHEKRNRVTLWESVIHVLG